MAGAATMVVIWGNILSFIGNVFALAVEVLVFNAFFPRNENRKSQWLCILLWWAIATFLSISVGTKFGYTLTMLQEVALPLFPFLMICNTKELYGFVKNQRSKEDILHAHKTIPS